MRQKLAKSPLRPVEYEIFGQKCVNFIVRDMTQKQMDMTHEYDMKNRWTLQKYDQLKIPEKPMNTREKGQSFLDFRG